MNCFGKILIVLLISISLGCGFVKKTELINQIQHFNFNQVYEKINLLNRLPKKEDAKIFISNQINSSTRISSTGSNIPGVNIQVSQSAIDGTQLHSSNPVPGYNTNLCNDQQSSTFLNLINTIDFRTNQLLSRLALSNVRNTSDMIEVGFEDPDLKSNGIYPSGNPPELTNNPDNVFEGKQALRICLDRNQSPVEYRTEFILDSQKYQRKFVVLQYDKEYWIGFAILLDNTYRIPRLRDILFQIHGTPDLILGEYYRNPTVTLSVSGDLDNTKLGVTEPHWTISIIGDDRRITPLEEHQYPTNILAAVSPVKGDIGHWVRWVLHFKQTYKPDGFMEIWKNGEKVFFRDNIRTTFNDVLGAYIKMGSYRWSWRHTLDYPVINPPFRLSYIDSLRIAQGENRYYDVAP